MVREKGDTPVRVPPKHASVGVKEARGDDDRARDLAQRRARGLAGQGPLPELGCGVGGEDDGQLEALAPVGVEVERGDLERGVLRTERAVRAPYLEHGLDREEGGGELVRVRLLLFARHAHRVWPQLALDREVGRLRAQEVVDDGPGRDRPAVVDLSCAGCTVRTRQLLWVMHFSHTELAALPEGRERGSHWTWTLTCQTSAPAVYSFPLPFQFRRQSR